jgi:hypothetical protein
VVPNLRFVTAADKRCFPDRRCLRPWGGISSETMSALSILGMFSRPLIDQLSLFKDKKHVGYAFRFENHEIPRADFELIAAEMLQEKAAASTLSVAGV